jgi:KH domain
MIFVLSHCYTCITGAKLKDIRDATGVRIDIPRKDSFSPNGTNGYLNGTSQPVTRSGTPLPPSSTVDGDEDGHMVPITIQGPAPLVEDARNQLLAIVATKTSKTTQRVRDIPQHVVPFVLVRKPLFEAAAQGDVVHLSWVEKDREVVVSGDREAVGRVIDRVKAIVQEFKTGLSFSSIQLPKRQHRLLVGVGNQEILRKSKCSVVVPKPEEPGEDVTIWGFPVDLTSGLQAVMEVRIDVHSFVVPLSMSCLLQRANSQHIHEYPLPGPITLSRQLLTYINKTSYTKSLMNEYSGVDVYPPSFVPLDKQGSVNVDFVGEKAAVDAAVRKFSELVAKLIGGTQDVEIDWLLHRVIQGKSSKKQVLATVSSLFYLPCMTRIKQFHDVHNVLLYFPPESAESSTIVLVYDPLSASASVPPPEKAKHLDEVEGELRKLAKDAADVKSETLIVDKKWHDAIIGQGGTTLNAIIGEDKALAIKLGHDAKKLVNGDENDINIIVIRGASADVDLASKEILRIVEEAKNNEIDNSHVSHLFLVIGVPRVWSLTLTVC